MALQLQTINKDKYGVKLLNGHTQARQREFMNHKLSHKIRFQSDNKLERGCAIKWLTH